MIPTIAKILAALPGVISGVEFILKIFVSYFPPKSREERAVDKYKKQVTEIKEVQLETSKAIKEAKHGRTQRIERMFDRH